MSSLEPRRLLVVGYAMKPEREKGFQKRHALPTEPVQDICFKRIDLSAPLAAQLAGVHLVLHRMMDDLQSVDWTQETPPQQAPLIESAAVAEAPISGQLNETDETVRVAAQSSGVPIAYKSVSTSHQDFSRGTQAGSTPGSSRGRGGEASTTSQCFKMSAGHTELERYCVAHPDLCVVDQFDCVRAVMDRFAIHDAIRDITLPGLAVNVRAPRAVRVVSLDTTTLSEAMTRAGMAYPCLLKPRVACGTPESHSMALLLKAEGLPQTQVPLPASLQEYVDHGGLQHKVYVLGSRLFHTPRVSMPDAQDVFDEHREAAVVTFDSLRTPLTASEKAMAASIGSSQPNGVDEAALEGIAGWLRKKLALTLFGFDVVVQNDSRDHVVVDVNYFPSFKDVPDGVAVPSLWSALREAYDGMFQAASAG